MNQFKQNNYSMSVYFALAGVLLVFSCLIKLGFWQLDRANDKEMRKQQYQQKQHKTLKQYPQQQAAAESINKQRIEVSGQLLHRYTWLLDNQVRNGQVGYNVLVGLKLSASDRIGIVNLGWVKAPLSRSELPTLSQWDNVQTFIGELHLPTKNPYAMAAIPTTTWPRVIAQIDTALMSQHSGLTLAPAVLRIDKDSPIGYLKSWRWGNKMTIDKHRAYAFQWFALALTLALLTGYFILRRLKEV